MPEAGPAPPAGPLPSLGREARRVELQFPASPAGGARAPELGSLPCGGSVTWPPPSVPRSAEEQVWQDPPLPCRGPGCGPWGPVASETDSADCKTVGGAVLGPHGDGGVARTALLLCSPPQSPAGGTGRSPSGGVGGRPGPRQPLPPPSPHPPSLALPRPGWAAVLPWAGTGHRRRR